MTPIMKKGCFRASPGTQLFDRKAPSNSLALEVRTGLAITGVGCHLRKPYNRPVSISQHRLVHRILGDDRRKQWVVHPSREVSAAEKVIATQLPARCLV